MRAVAAIPGSAAALVVPDAVAPVAARRAGFNQSHEIARVVSRLLDLQLAEHALRRIRATAPQVGLVARANAPAT